MDTRNPNLRLAALATLALLGGTLAGCGSTASSTDMIPTGITVEQKIDGAVRLEATGSGGFRENVSGEDLATALRQGVLDSGLFSAVAESGPADWILSVAVAEVTDPEPDLFPEVQASLVWRLTDGSGARVVWEQTITTKAEASPQDHLDYVEREGIATGRAIAKNLVEGLERMSRLDLAR